MNRRWLPVLLLLLLVLALGGMPAGAASDLGEPQAVEGSPPVDAVPAGASTGEWVEVVAQFKSDSVAKHYYDLRLTGQTFTPEQQRSWAKELMAEQNRGLAALNTSDFRDLGRFTVGYNGVFMQIRKDRVADLAKANGVVAIHTVKPIYLEPDNSTSVPFIGAYNVWENVVDSQGRRVTGQGIRVAVIDTGIDYTHADFGGAGNPADYQNDDHTIVEPGSFPTAKVIGGYDFAGSNYDAGSADPAKRLPQPDPDPIDENGHGSHVAGTIAGLGTDEIGPGVAPGALLYAYKVFGRSGSTALVAEAIERALDPNQDGDITDHVDVINMSLGSDFGSPDDPSAVAAENAALAGVVVVASAGNAGNVPYITGSPAVAPDVISVAASVDNGIEADGIRINSPDAIAGTYEAAEGAITVPLKATGDVTGDLVYVGLARATDTMPDLTGKIALIDRGAVTFAEKILTVQKAGAIAAVVVNNVPGDPIVMGGTSTGITIPGVMIGLDTGALIKSQLSSGATVNVTLSASIKIPKPQLADTLASFTSRGPARPDSAFKPDVAAPGFNITSVAMGTGTGSATFSGTSMAAPHTAGAAALLLQAHPAWSPEQVKAALMETAVQTHSLAGDPYPLSLQGAGRIQVDKAVSVPALVLPSSLGLGYVAATNQKLTIRETLQITNETTSPEKFTIGWSFRTPTENDGAVLLQLPQTVQVGPRSKKAVTVSFSVDPAELTDATRLSEYDGYITLTETTSGAVLKVPFQLLPQRQSRLDATVSANADGSYTLTLQNTGSATGRAVLYVDGSADQKTPSLPPEMDLRATGARPLAGGKVVEFLAATYGKWATPDTVEFDVYIDTNHDGQPEYIAFNGDLGALTGGSYMERQVSAVYNVSTGRTFLQYYITTGGTYNQSVMGIPVNVAYLGGASSFDYWVVSWDRDTDLPDFIHKGYVFFDTAATGLLPSQWDIPVPPGSSVTLPVQASTAGGSLVAAYPTNSPDQQLKVIDLSGH